MTIAKPDWVPIPIYELDYEHIVKTWGWMVLEFDTCGSYQGDHCVLLGDNEKRGFLMIGYGSCSGCDELEAIRPYEWYDGDEPQDWGPVVALSERLESQIHWEPASSALAEWLESMLVSEGSGTDWYWYDDKVKAVTRRYLTRLKDEANGK